ncbi:MAG TPA: HD domain-containing protein, partial [Acidimicrobiia bacterium]|nr:HD domain-containing protein [Acidimicrobiia bacterium]
MTGDSHGALTPIAQTNLQLYNQVLAGGWSDADLARVKRAYTFATEILSNRYRPDGKSFVAHLVGTASALTSAGCDPDLVVAGLLHAAYAWGEWGEGSHQMTAAKRAELRAVIGERSERLVAAYTRLGWQAANAEAVLGRVDELSRDERDVVLMKIANELDDNADLGLRYRGNSSDDVAHDAPALLSIEIADALHEAYLSDELRKAHAAEVAADVPEPVVCEHDFVFVPPRTHRRRLLVWYRAGDTAVSKVARRAGRRV